MLNLIGTHKRLKDLACLHLSPTISDGLGGSACMMSPATAKSLQSCPTLCNPIDGSPPGSSVHGISRAKYWSGLPFSSSEDLPNPGIKPASPALAGGFFTAEPPGKPSQLHAGGR